MWFDQLQELVKQGDVIYDVYAMTSPDDEEGTKIAEIVMDTRLHTSKFGDDRLFFQHRGIQRDRGYWPAAWLTNTKDFRFIKSQDYEFPLKPDLDMWPTDNLEAYKMLQDQRKKYNCPFAWILGKY